MPHLFSRCSCQTIGTDVNSPHRQLRIDPFCVTNIFLQERTQQMSPLSWTKKTLGHGQKNPKKTCFCGSAVQLDFPITLTRRREGSLFPFNPAALLDLQGINIVDRVGCSPLREKGENIVRKRLSVNEWRGHLPQQNVNEEQRISKMLSMTGKMWACRQYTTVTEILFVSVENKTYGLSFHIGSCDLQGSASECWLFLGVDCQLL